MNKLLRIEKTHYYTYYYYQCRQCGKEVRYARRCIKSEPICVSCQKVNNKVKAFKKQIEKENAIVNDVLDDILKKLLVLREDIDRFGYDDDSVRVYDDTVKIIEMFRR